MAEIQGENGTALTGKQFTDGTSAGTLEKVGVINNLGHRLWEQIVLHINDTKVQIIMLTRLCWKYFSAMMMSMKRVFCVGLVLRKTMETLRQTVLQQHIQTRDS